MILHEQLARHPKLFEHRLVAWINKIAAEFFPRKLFFVDQRNSVAASRQRNRRSRSSRAGADYRNIKWVHSEALTLIGANSRNGNVR